MHTGLRDIQQMGPTTREWVVDGHVYAGLGKFGIIQAGWSDASLGFCFQRSQQPVQSVIACCAGTGRAWVNGKWLNFGPGMSYAIPTDATFGYKAVDASHWHLVWVMFDDDPNRPAHVAGRHARLEPADAEGLKSAIQGLYHEGTHQRDQEACRHWASLVSHYAAEIGRPAHLVIPQHSPLDEVWFEVRRDLSRSWDLDAMAEIAGVGTEQLRKLSQLTIRRSPMQEVLRMRMEHAAGLLARTKMKVQEIAWAVGYRNAFAFSTAFHRVKGMSPAQFRRRKLSRRPG